MDDAIKRALEVAAEATCKARNYGCGGECSQCRVSSAAAIAAFLEALPNEMLDTVPDVGYMDAVACRNAWLAAVRRAAGGG